MPLLNDQLSVWEIAHRWAGFDPEGLHWRLPLGVRDYARNLFGAIDRSELESQTLSMDKWSSEDGEEAKPFFIRYHLEDIFDLIAGKRYKRSLMKWAVVSREDFFEWCERHEIPPPEFWFPAGWGMQYDWKADETNAQRSLPSEGLEGDGTSPELRAPARSRIAAQEMAEALWAEVPDMTIADMIRHPDLVKYAKASHYQPDTVRRWLSEVAPTAVRNKRGRPRKNPLPE